MRDDNPALRTVLMAANSCFAADQKLSLTIKPPKGKVIKMGNAATAIERYVELRDRKSAIKKAADVEIAQIDEMLQKIEMKLLEQMDDVGIESMSSPFGSVYVNVKTGARPADWDAFWAYIRENNLSQMIEKRVSSKAVAEFIEATKDEKHPEGQIPPGVDLYRERGVSIRRK